VEAPGSMFLATFWFERRIVLRSLLGQAIV